MSVKGVGTILYLDHDADDTYVAVSCITEVKPVGYVRGTETDEPCLGDTSVKEDTGDLQFSPIEAMMHYTANDTLNQNLETAITNDDVINVAIKLPYSTAVYQYTTAKISELEPETVTRENKIKRKITLLIQSAPTYSGTVPTT